MLFFLEKRFIYFMYVSTLWLCLTLLEFILGQMFFFSLFLDEKD